MSTRPEQSTRDPTESQCLYVFLDEGRNLDFSSKGPFSLDRALVSLRYDLLEEGLSLERFHASEDRQAVRNRVFGAIAKHLSEFRVDRLIVEKRKTEPPLQEQAKFYAAMLGYLLKYVLKEAKGDQYRQIIVKTDSLPLRKKRDAFEKAIKMTLTAMLPGTVTYRVLHHDSRSSPCLQVADYCNWAIYKKWTEGDVRSYDLIKEAIKSEFDIFRTGTKGYY